MGFLEWKRTHKDLEKVIGKEGMTSPEANLRRDAERKPRRTKKENKIIGKTSKTLGKKPKRTLDIREGIVQGFNSKVSVGGVEGRNEGPVVN